MIERLENNEQILLMYLAGELPAEDLREVEQMLAGDASLRGERDRLALTQSAVWRGLDALDESTAHPGRADAAARLASRELRRRMTQPRRMVETAAGRPRGRGWWAYPFAAAAVVALGTSVWMNRPEPAAAVRPHTSVVSDVEARGYLEAVESVGQDRPVVAMANAHDEDGPPRDELSDLMLGQQ